METPLHDLDCDLLSHLILDLKWPMTIFSLSTLLFVAQAKASSLEPEVGYAIAGAFNRRSLPLQ